jgi:lipoic acid synthetase
MSARDELWVCNLGATPYREATELQALVRAARQRGDLPDVLLLLEHPPVYTRGRRAKPEELTLGEAFYARRGIEVHDTDRGGRVTYHGPGQLVGYPIMAVTDVHAHLRAIEHAIVAVLAAEGVTARARAADGPDYTGVWVGERKIASIGVHLSRGVSTHGFAINVDVDVEPFSWIVACGLPDVQMTSLALELSGRGDDADPRTLRDRVRERVAARFAAVHARERVSVGVERLRAPRRAATRSRANPGGMDVRTHLGADVRPLRERKPPWLKVPAPGGERYRALKSLITGENLHTVCQEAACPNVGECWERGTATFMILGDTCTRRCGFCNVKTGKPTWHDPLEPARVARSIARMGLRHAVITSVDRDDLADKGAGAFAAVIRQVRRQAPECRVEVLTPDFQGQEMPLARVIAERPDVFNHNVEVVPRLYPVARRGSEFERSCRVLALAHEMGEGEVVTKSGLMVGLGETEDELLEAFARLREVGVAVLTVGQYLRPSEQHLPVVRYWHPDEFAELERAAYGMGFEHVAGARSRVA